MKMLNELIIASSQRVSSSKASSASILNCTAPPSSVPFGATNLSFASNSLLGIVTVDYGTERARVKTKYRNKSLYERWHLSLIHI